MPTDEQIARIQRAVCSKSERSTHPKYEDKRRNVGSDDGSKLGRVKGKSRKRPTPGVFYLSKNRGSLRNLAEALCGVGLSRPMSYVGHDAEKRNNYDAGGTRRQRSRYTLYGLDKLTGTHRASEQVEVVYKALQAMVGNGELTPVGGGKWRVDERCMERHRQIREQQRAQKREREDRAQPQRRYAVRRAS